MTERALLILLRCRPTHSPPRQVSFDVAWSPKCVDKRCYDYVTIAEFSDLVFVMSYDEQSQIMGDCVAMANAPLSQTLDGTVSILFVEKLQKEKKYY